MGVDSVNFSMSNDFPMIVEKMVFDEKIWQPVSLVSILLSTVWYQSSKHY
jgi:hypothetical protein